VVEGELSNWRVAVGVIVVVLVAGVVADVGVTVELEAF